MPKAAPRRTAFTLVELLVVIAIIGILVALLLPAVQAAREAARRAQCQSNLKNVALAVLNYESTNKEFPEAVTSEATIGSLGRHTAFNGSWLISTLPYLESQALFDSFDFDQLIAGGTLAETGRPNFVNIRARGTEIAVLKCPSDGNNITKFVGKAALGDNWARGNYAGNVGPANWLSGSSSTGVQAPAAMSGGEPSDAWLGKNPRSRVNWPASIRGVFGPNDTVRVAQITDGTSKTMMIAEIRSGIEERDWRGAWALPFPGGSLVARHGAGGDSNGPNNCGPKSDDHATSLTNMQCLPLSDQLSLECMTCNDDNDFAQAAPRSSHVGGVFAAMADGSIRFVGDDIETTGGGPCCAAWDHLIMASDDLFVFRSFR
ncbi:DUF1559 domain-containing protein [Botrimarina sp.]|uniref:DUF1559 family PulG-like putative transporter n=1 Tax=Botrimarina sp. TaxID=2795802 RepID=UPI0032EB6DEA